MYIYLDQNTIENSVSFLGKDSNAPQFLGIFVRNYETAPHIYYNEDIEMLIRNEKLTPVFLKATDVQFPKYYPVRRELGLYRYGDALGELVSGKDSPFCLKLETKTPQGMLDMEVLQRKIQAGSIHPVISYESGQQKKHLLVVLRQLLAERKLPHFKKFVLALRLLTTKQYV